MWNAVGKQGPIFPRVKEKTQRIINYGRQNTDELHTLHITRAMHPPEMRGTLTGRDVRIMETEVSPRCHGDYVNRVVMVTKLFAWLLNLNGCHDN